MDWIRSRDESVFLCKAKVEQSPTKPMNLSGDLSDLSLIEAKKAVSTRNSPSLYLILN
ncbi:hypothetical protein MARINOS108_11542 [Marinoscillum sp. 108]|nr:hypothetical protein MARINOS108_11542 [Marinoscillum sp. 108]